MNSVARVVRELVYGPEPIGAADARVLAQAEARELAGAGGGGTPHFGLRGTPATTWAGWTASPQQFQGNIQMGKGVAVVETYAALPNDSVPTSMPGWLAQMETLDQGAV